MTVNTTPTISPTTPAKPSTPTDLLRAQQARNAAAQLARGHADRLSLIAAAQKIVDTFTTPTVARLVAATNWTKGRVDNAIRTIRRHPEMYPAGWPGDGLEWTQDGGKAGDVVAQSDGQGGGSAAPVEQEASVAATPPLAGQPPATIDVRTFAFTAAPTPFPDLRTVEVTRIDDRQLDYPVDLKLIGPSYNSVVEMIRGTAGDEVASEFVQYQDEQAAKREARRLAKNEKKRLARARAREAKAASKADGMPPAKSPTSPVDASAEPAPTITAEPPPARPVGVQDVGGTQFPAEPDPVYVIHPFEGEPAEPAKPTASVTPPTPATPPKAKAETRPDVPSKPLPSTDLAKLPREDRIREYRRLAEHATDLDSKILRFTWNYYEGSGRFPTDLLIADKFNVSTAVVARTAEKFAELDVWICRRVKAGVPVGPVAQLGVGGPRACRDAGYVPTPEEIESAKATIQADWPHERPEDRRLPSQPEAKAEGGLIAIRRGGVNVDGGRSA